MSLTFTANATPGIATLHPDWAPKLRAYALLRDQQQAADAEARAAKAAADAAKDEILTALAGARHFEQTVMSLAATIHLLNVRLAETPGDVATVQLEPGRRTAQAA